MARLAAGQHALAFQLGSYPEGLPLPRRFEQCESGAQFLFRVAASCDVVGPCRAALVSSDEKSALHEW